MQVTDVTNTITEMQRDVRLLSYALLLMCAVLMVGVSYLFSIWRMLRTKAKLPELPCTWMRLTEGQHNRGTYHTACGKTVPFGLKLNDQKFCHSCGRSIDIPETVSISEAAA